jgi:PmbA protein
MDLERMSKRSVHAVLEEGAKEAETYLVRVRSLTAYVDDDRIKNLEEKLDQGLSVRVSVNGRLGQSSSTMYTTRDMEECGMKAVSLAKLSRPDPYFKRFPGFQQSNGSVEVCEEDVLTTTHDMLREKASEIVGSVGEGVKVPRGLLRVAIIERALANSNGAAYREKGTMAYAHFTSMTKGADPGEGCECYYSSGLSALDPQKMGSGLRTKALNARSAQHFKGKMTGSVILPPEELAEMLLASVGHALDGENALRHRSPWGELVGHEVGNELVDLRDQPWDARSALSCKYDDEGTPTREKPLVDRGVLRTLLYDSYHAQMGNVTPTGNCLRRDPADALNLYRRGSATLPVNLAWKAGTKSVDEMISEMKEGIVVEKLAAPDVNGVTGGFALEVRSAKLVRGGQVEGYVDQCLLVGNFYQALKRVGAVGNDIVVHRNCIVPSVRFDDLEIVGSE